MAAKCSLLRRGPRTVSCRLRHCFEYTRKSEGEERKGPLPNNVHESTFQSTNREFLVRQFLHFPGLPPQAEMNPVVSTRNRRGHKKYWIISTCYLLRCYRKNSALIFGEQPQQHLQIIWQRLFSFFSAFGVPSNRIDTNNLKLCGHNNLCGGEIAKCKGLDSAKLLLHLQCD